MSLTQYRPNISILRLPVQSCGTAFQLVFGKLTSAMNSISSWWILICLGVEITAHCDCLFKLCLFKFSYLLTSLFTSTIEVFVKTGCRLCMSCRQATGKSVMTSTYISHRYLTLTCCLPERHIRTCTWSYEVVSAHQPGRHQRHGCCSSYQPGYPADWTDRHINNNVRIGSLGSLSSKCDFLPESLGDLLHYTARLPLQLARYGTRDQMGPWMKFPSSLQAQVRRLGPKVGSRLTLFCIHNMNQVNSRNDSEPCCQHQKQVNTVVALLLLLLYGHNCRHQSDFWYDVILSRWKPWTIRSLLYMQGASGGCPLACRAHVTSVARCMRYSSW